MVGARVLPGPLLQRRAGQPNLILHVVGLNLKHPAGGSGGMTCQGTGDRTGTPEMQSLSLQGCSESPWHILPPFYSLQECP